MPEVHVIDEKPMSMTLVVTETAHGALEIIQAFLETVDQETLVPEGLNLDGNNASRGVVLRLFELAEEWASDG